MAIAKNNLNMNKSSFINSNEELKRKPLIKDIKLIEGDLYQIKAIWKAILILTILRNKDNNLWDNWMDIFLSLTRNKMNIWIKEPLINKSKAKKLDHLKCSKYISSKIALKEKDNLPIISKFLWYLKTSRFLKSKHKKKRNQEDKFMKKNIVIIQRIVNIVNIVKPQKIANSSWDTLLKDYKFREQRKTL